MSGSPEKLTPEQIAEIRSVILNSMFWARDHAEALLAHIAALQAENERMEAALREMAEMGHFSVGGSPTMSSYPETHRKRCPGCIAEAALPESSR